MLSIPRAASLTNLDLQAYRCVSRRGQRKTNLSDFHRVLRGTAGVVLHVVLLGDFVEPELKKKKKKTETNISARTADGIWVSTPAATTRNVNVRQENKPPQIVSIGGEWVWV